MSVPASLERDKFTDYSLLPRQCPTFVTIEPDEVRYGRVEHLALIALARLDPFPLEPKCLIVGLVSSAARIGASNQLSKGLSFSST